uniref:Uncharacterized protein n=1 Tax=Arundo donax TaxID=35708 RepID=A0A0A9EWM7_ARUDO
MAFISATPSSSSPSWLPAMAMGCGCRSGVDGRWMSEGGLVL